MSDFQQWWTETYSAGVYKSAAEQAWNHQQAEIERLNARLSMARNATCNKVEKLQTEIERLQAHLESASCPHGCFSGDNGRYLSDGSFLKCFWCAVRKQYIQELFE